MAAMGGWKNNIFVGAASAAKTRLDSFAAEAAPTIPEIAIPAVKE